MNPQVNAIAGRLSLRPPQRRSLEILDRITEIVPPKKGVDIAAALAVIRAEFPAVTDFERDFPSLCFALATGVGKTRLMGAFISYLYLAHGLRNFFVLAPNLTIYNKLIADFTPNTSKYVFKGIAEFATDEPTKIVIHVNMLKEGWDVTNLYTIVPLRAANARILIEQSIGRGLRLPYGHRTGVSAVDRLNIIAHDKFQEIVDEAKKSDSPIRLQQVILEPEQLDEKTVTIVSQSQLASKLGLQPEQTTTSTLVPKTAEPPVFTTPEDQKVAQITYHGKPWKYLLIPHDVIADNITLEWLASQFEPK